MRSDRWTHAGEWKPTSHLRYAYRDGEKVLEQKWQRDILTARLPMRGWPLFRDPDVITEEKWEEVEEDI